MADTPSTTTGSSPALCIKEALPDLPSWVRFFLNAEIPVLQETALALEDLRAREEDVDASMLAELIHGDPFMTVKVLAYVASKRRNPESTQTETVVSSLVMMGVAPFFRTFGPQPTVQDRLRDQADALAVLLGLIQRANRAAQFAVAFAVHRGDADVDMVRQAAFLYEFAEMLMCCHAPVLEMEVRAMQHANPTLRTVSLQRFVFNIDLSDLRQELMEQWRFSDLLLRMSNGKHTEHPSAHNVMLSVRLARHTEQGWDNAAVPDDIDDIARLLNAPPRVAHHFAYKIDQPA